MYTCKVYTCTTYNKVVISGSTEVLHIRSWRQVWRATYTTHIPTYIVHSIYIITYTRR